MSTPTENSIRWLEELLSLQGLKTQVSSTQAPSGFGDDSYWLTIDTTSLSQAQVAGLIGERGRVLDSIQYLANITLNIGVSKEEQHSYTIEIDGYRKKRQAELQAIADEAAKAVLSSGKDYEIKGLSSAERRQVHGLLGQLGQFETYSRGREPERHLVVHLATTQDNNEDGEDAELDGDFSSEE